MSASERRKGKEGERLARHALTKRDWTVDDLNDGKEGGDLLAHSPEGIPYLVEVKNVKIINVPAIVKQAQTQAKARKLPWLVMCRLPLTDNMFLVYRQGERPAVWI